MDGRNPKDDFRIINEELRKYSEKLATRKQIIVASKADVANDELYQELKELAKEKNIEIFKISSSTGEGVKELLDFVSKTLKTLPKEELYVEEEKMIYTLEDNKNEFTVICNQNKFEVKGEAVERLIRRINIDDNESMYYLHKNLVNLGVEAELKKQGIKEGDIVKISNYELEWYE